LKIELRVLLEKRRTELACVTDSIYQLMAGHSVLHITFSAIYPLKSSTLGKFYPFVDVSSDMKRVDRKGEFDLERSVIPTARCYTKKIIFANSTIHCSQSADCTKICKPAKYTLHSFGDKNHEKDQAYIGEPEAESIAP